MLFQEFDYPQIYSKALVRAREFAWEFANSHGPVKREQELHENWWDLTGYYHARKRKLPTKFEPVQSLKQELQLSSEWPRLSHSPENAIGLVTKWFSLNHWSWLNQETPNICITVSVCIFPNSTPSRGKRHSHSHRRIVIRTQGQGCINSYRCNISVIS
jgi:hypothetical protein